MAAAYALQVPRALYNIYWRAREDRVYGPCSRVLWTGARKQCSPTEHESSPADVRR